MSLTQRLGKIAIPGQPLRADTPLYPHSYLMASTGFNLEARQEGYNVAKKQMITADNATKKISLNST